MKKLSSLELFKKLGHEVFSVLVIGESDFFEEELSQKIRKENIFELMRFSGAKTQLEAGLNFAETATPGLFNPNILVWLKWSSLGFDKNFPKQKLEDLAQPQRERVFLFQIESVAKKEVWMNFSWDAVVDLSDIETQKRVWILDMAQRLKFKLEQDQVVFLESLDVSLLEVKRYLELWELGGDFWASAQLNYEKDLLQPGASGYKAKVPAFDWVDAVLDGRASDAEKILKKLLVDRREEPMALAALLSKSVRILESLRLRLDLSGENPYLVERLKRKKNAKSARLLTALADFDRLIKTKSIKSENLLASLHV